MTEAEWLACMDPDAMWKWLMSRVDNRHLQLAARAAFQHRHSVDHDGRAVELIRCVFGNPFQSAALVPSCRTPEVLALARTIRDEGTYSRMPELGDLLQSAGCTDLRILEHCQEGRRHASGCWVVDLVLGTDALVMTQAKWQTSQDPSPMLEVIRDESKVRKAWLCAIAFCRRIERYMTDARCRQAFAASEQFVEEAAADYASRFSKGPGDVGPNRNDEWRRAYDAKNEAMAAHRYLDAVVAQAVCALPFNFNAGTPNMEAIRVARNSADVMGELATDDPERDRLVYDTARLDEQLHQAIIVRCIFGDPFRPVVVDPAWLTWNGGTVVQLAQVIYDERAFDRLPILADALKDASCQDAAILDHCRGLGPHVRGCWVVDLVLGKS